MPGDEPTFASGEAPGGISPSSMSSAVAMAAWYDSTSVDSPCNSSPKPSALAWLKIVFFLLLFALNYLLSKVHVGWMITYFKRSLTYYYIVIY